MLTRRKTDRPPLPLLGRRLGSKLLSQVTFDLKRRGEGGIAVELNGEVAGGPLDAFFMSRPRYTPGCTSMVQHRLRPSIETFPLSRFSSNVESGLLHRFVRTRNRTIPPSTREDQRTARFLLDSSVILRFLFLSFRDDQFRGGGWIFSSPCLFCLSPRIYYSR